MENITLKIAEAPQNLVGRGIAVVDPKVIQDNGWQSGDVIEISGNKRTFAKLWPGQTVEYGRGLIRMDGYMRASIGAGLDDRVNIKKADAKPATSLVLYPTEPLRIVGAENYLTQLMEGRVVNQGANITINIMGRRIDLVIAKAEAHQADAHPWMVELELDQRQDAEPYPLQVPVALSLEGQPEPTWHVLPCAERSCKALLPCAARPLRLDVDPLFIGTLTGAFNAIFLGASGRLDAAGDAVLRVAIPAAPALVGLRFHIAFVTYTPGYFLEFSNDHEFVIRA